MLLEVPRPEARRLRVDFQIELPRGVNTRIHEAKGDLQVGGLQGTLAISLASGDVQISDHAGRVDLDVKSGDLTVTQVNGDVFMDFKHGDVDLADVRGRVHGRVISGDVQVTHAQGASLDVINGDVDVRDVVGDIEIDTKSGDVDLRAIRPGRLKVRAISGDVSAAVAVLGQGDVTIETISGDIGLGLPPGRPRVHRSLGAVRRDRLRAAAGGTQSRPAHTVRGAQWWRHRRPSDRRQRRHRYRRVPRMNERLRILEMVKDGKITPEEGARLLDELDRARAPRTSGANLRVSIRHPSGRKSQFAVPVAVADAILTLIPDEMRSRLQARGVNLEQLVRAIQSGEAQGRIVDIHDPSGASVEVVVE
ncbi:MAG: DUF4097 family beta strand repeat protein [Armatimonadetes bacterium]|nr:DUF4097 family beta strand repeat protein [Armatimonadota bacterium]